MISYLIIAYNQREYIRAALESALAQDFSPMEILVSDDCSTDGTSELLAEIAAGYHGPHQLRIHRNPQNLGIIRNLENAFAMAQGELIVKADGDDISDNRRVSRIVEEWDKSGRQAYIVAHGTTLIDLDGNVTGHSAFPFVGWNPLAEHDVLWGKPKHYQGNSCAFRRELFTGFPAVEYKGAVDDLVLALRALALGGPKAFWHLADELTLYRIGSGCTNDYRSRRRTVGRTYSMIFNAFRQFELDLSNTLQAKLPPERRNALLRWTRQAKEYYGGAAELYNSTTFRERLYGFKMMGGRGLFSRRLPLFATMLLTSPNKI